MPKRKPYTVPKVRTAGRITSLGSRSNLHEFNRTPTGEKIKGYKGIHALVEKRKVKPEEIWIIEKLRQANIRVEQPIVVADHGVAVYRKSGLKLEELIPFLKKHRGERNRVASLSASLLGKVHAQGIAHRHPHSRNIVIDSRFSPTLIDFKLARQIKSIDWNRVKSIRMAFGEDWERFAETLFELGFDVSKTMEFFKKMVDRYPCLPGIKERLPGEILQELRKRGTVQLGR